MKIELVKPTYGTGCAPDLIVASSDFLKAKDNEEAFQLAAYALNLFMENQEVAWRFSHPSSRFIRKQIEENGKGGNLVFAIVETENEKHLEVYLIQQNKPSRLQVAIGCWEG